MTLIRVAALIASLAPFAALSVPPEPAPPDQRVIASWAKAAFPALSSAQSVPENLYVGFVVNEQLQVLHHAVILRPGPRPMLQDVAATYPGVSVAGSPMGGIAEVPSASGNPKYRVIWVMVPSS